MTTQTENVSIAAHRQGGFLGFDQRISITPEKVKVTDTNGTEIKTRERSPQPSEMIIFDLARRVTEHLEKIILCPEFLPSDAMTLSIVIEIGDAQTLFAISSGDEAPPEVWELVGAINEIADYTIR